MLTRRQREAEEKQLGMEAGMEARALGRKQAGSEAGMQRSRQAGSEAKGGIQKKQRRGRVEARQLDGRSEARSEAGRGRQIGTDRGTERHGEGLAGGTQKKNLLLRGRGEGTEVKGGGETENQRWRVVWRYGEREAEREAATDGENSRETRATGEQ